MVYASMLDFRTNTFLKVCQTLNYSKAASDLCITQPAVSQHIRFIEEEYNVKLFNYENKKISLTKEGKILRERLLCIQNDEIRIKEELQSSKNGKFSITIGVTMTVGEYAIHNPLSVLLKNHPNWSIHVRYGNTQKLLEYLDEGSIDIGLAEGYYPQNNYDHQPFSTQPFIAVCHCNHAFAVQNVKTLNDLVSERVVVREKGSGTREILERSLAIKGLTFTDFKSSVEVGNMSTIVQLLKKDSGISFLYKIAVEEELTRGILKEIHLKDFKVEHNFDFIWQKNSIYSDQMKSICKEFIDANKN